MDVDVLMRVRFDINGIRVNLRKEWRMTNMKLDNTQQIYIHWIEELALPNLSCFEQFEERKGGAITGHPIPRTTRVI